MELPQAPTALVVQHSRDPRKGLDAALEWLAREFPDATPSLIVPTKRTLTESGISPNEYAGEFIEKKQNKDGSYGSPRAIISFLPINPAEFRVDQSVPHCVVPQAALSIPDGDNYFAKTSLDEALPDWLPWVAGTAPQLIGDGTAAWTAADLPNAFPDDEADILAYVQRLVAGYGGSINGSSLNRRDITQTLEQLREHRGSPIPWSSLERWAWENGWGGFAIAEFHKLSKKFTSEEP